MGESKAAPVRPVFAFVAGVFLALLFMAMTSRSTMPRAGRKGDFVLLVHLDFTTEKDRDDFVRLAAEHQQLAYVRDEEPATLSYEICLADNDQMKAVFIERYADKAEAYHAVHKQSSPFLDFRQKLQAMQDSGAVSITGQSYLTSGLGFIDSPLFSDKLA